MHIQYIIMEDNWRCRCNPCYNGMHIQYIMLNRLYFNKLKSNLHFKNDEKSLNLLQI